MFSYQQEFPKDLKGIVDAIEDYKGSEERSKLLMYKSYFNGENDFIEKFKRMIWSDKQKRVIENVIAPNYKTRYNFFADMVSQKVNTLFAETPSIKDMDSNESKQIGYCLNNAGKEASIEGYSFTYVGLDSLKPFETENCIAYTDDMSGEIKAFIRFWVRNINGKEITFFELYEEDGFTTYKVDKGIAAVFKEKQGYKVKIDTSKLSSISTNIKLSKIPIVLFKNNKEMTSDLKLNIKCKIDMIDFIQSGLINNIDEFSDVWITINVPSATMEQVQEIKENIRRSKATVFAGTDEKNSVGFETLQIPYEARAKAIELLKGELIEDAGVIDFKDIKGAATNVQIEARLLKLKQRVSDFEWFADEAATEIVKLWQEYHNEDFDIDITFNKLYIKNNQEIINQALSLHNYISEYSFLNMLKSVGVIDDIEEEIKRLQKEGVNKFQITDNEGDDYGQGTF